MPNTAEVGCSWHMLPHTEHGIHGFSAIHSIRGRIFYWFSVVYIVSQRLHSVADSFEILNQKSFSHFSKSNLKRNQFGKFKKEFKWKKNIGKESQQELTIHRLNWMCLCASAWVSVRASILNVETVVFWVYHVGTVATLQHTKKSHRRLYGWIGYKQTEHTHAHAHTHSDGNNGAHMHRLTLASCESLTVMWVCVVLAPIHCRWWCSIRYCLCVCLVALVRL